jgi:NADPH:quinone reductase-like Zn-dependent oxidoreductase
MKNAMKAAEIAAYGGNGVITINHEAQKPALSPGQVMIAIRAAGVNPADWKIREGYFQKMAPLDFPIILGSDFSGVVIDVGADVKGFKINDEVFGQAGRLAGGSGTFAEVAVADPGKIRAKPENLSFVEAAALPLAGLSAIQALYDHAKLSSGQKILITGGTGGIGSLAIQIAKHIGAFVAATASTAHLEQARELGADQIIDYSREEFEHILSGYDVVFDTAGGSSYAKAYQVLKPGGMIISMTEQPRSDLEEQFQVKAISQFTQSSPERLDKLAELTAAGTIKPLIDRVFSLSQAPEALEYQQKSHPRGKVIIEAK